VTMQKILQTSNGGFSASLIVSVAERTIINSPHISCSLYTYTGVSKDGYSLDVSPISHYLDFIFCAMSGSCTYTVLYDVLYI
jgi:hypothetical protein